MTHFPAPNSDPTRNATLKAKFKQKPMLAVHTILHPVISGFLAPPIVIQLVGCSADHVRRASFKMCRSSRREWLAVQLRGAFVASTARPLPFPVNEAPCS
jgi:hypothetical protein